jgi:hypothetical protein
MNRDLVWNEVRYDNEILNVEGILYAKRFDRKRLDKHKKKIMFILELNDIKPKRTENGFILDGYDSKNIAPRGHLLEELIVLNKAELYQRQGLNNVSSLCEHLKEQWAGLVFKTRTEEANILLNKKYVLSFL